MKKFKKHVWAIYIVWCIPLAILGFIIQGVITLIKILFIAPYEVGTEYFDKLFSKIKNNISND